MGVSRNVMDAYHWLTTRYEPGDRIALFGFSRGAYTARSLAGMISACGLIDTADLDEATIWRQISTCTRPGTGGAATPISAGGTGSPSVRPGTICADPGALHRGMGHGRRARRPGLSGLAQSAGPMPPLRLPRPDAQPVHPARPPRPGHGRAAWSLHAHPVVRTGTGAGRQAGVVPGSHQDVGGGHVRRA